MARPTEREIRNEENEAGADAADNKDKFSGRSYAEGVSAALYWVLGKTDEKPYTEE